jgi:hypothetical protein
VKWNDGGPALKSSLGHLEHLPDDSSSSDDDEAESKAGGDDDDQESKVGSDDDDEDALREDALMRTIIDEANAAARNVREEDTREGNVSDTDSEGDADQATDSEGTAMGEEVIAGDLAWERVANVGIDRRGDKPLSRGRAKGMDIDTHTDLSQIWEHFLPVSLSKMLAVVKERAAMPIHRETGKFDVRGLKAFFCILFGACQFKPGTDLWSVEQAGMMPPPNFGRCTSQDKFRRWMKCLAMGPVGDDNKGPWHEIEWLFTGFNKGMKAKWVCSWQATIDESTWKWSANAAALPNSIPHLSARERKPEPLGLETKNTCCGESGVMLFMEKLEGKCRMAGKKCNDRHQCTTATTLRLIEGAGLDEKGKRPEDVVGCTVNGDSWFASHQTAKACMDELAVHFVGNVKTATKHFPKKEMWACLGGSDRGDHVVFRNVANNVHAVGWNNGHKKTFVCSAGSSNPSKEALYKRQRDDGTTFQRRVHGECVLGVGERGGQRSLRER